MGGKLNPDFLGLRTMLSMIPRLLTKLVTFSGHLKRFKEGMISGNKSLKVVAIFILLRIIMMELCSSSPT